MARKKVVSEAERQRRMRQAAQAAAPSDASKSVAQSQKKLTKPGHPSTLTPGRQKSTGRGT